MKNRISSGAGTTNRFISYVQKDIEDEQSYLKGRFGNTGTLELIDSIPVEEK